MSASAPSLSRPRPNRPRRLLRRLGAIVFQMLAASLFVLAREVMWSCARVVLIQVSVPLEDGTRLSTIARQKCPAGEPRKLVEAKLQCFAAIQLRKALEELRKEGLL